MKRSRLFALALFLCANVAAADADPFVTLDRPGAAKLVDPAGHTKPTIVALWSSDCVYCKKNLKLFADMAKANPRLQLITVAAESPGDGLAEALDRLAVPGARFAYGDETPEVLAYAVDPKWRGELPRTILFDGRGGKRALSGVVTEPDALRWLGLAQR